MTHDQQTILMFKGLIGSLPAESQEKVKKAEQTIREVLATFPDGEATIALGLIGAELQCNELEYVRK